MAKVSFTDNLNIRPARQTFPRLSKLKKGEKVRIQLVDPTNIEMEFVHNLNAPIVENGEGILDQNGKYKTRFMGNPISLGDISIIEDKGIDVKNCPISKFHREHPDWVDAPKRKFAMHIIKYRTRPGTFKLAAPYSVEHLIWVFTEKTYLKLREFTETWGDLRKHDLYIECESEQFQQYSIQVAPEAGWVTEEEVASTKAVYDAGVEEYPDISLAIGSRKEKKWIEADLEEIENAWNLVLGKSNSGGFTEPSGMAGFLDSPSKATASATSDDAEDIISALAGESSKKSTSSFEDLLGELQ